MNPAPADQNQTVKEQLHLPDIMGGNQKGPGTVCHLAYNSSSNNLSGDQVDTGERFIENDQRSAA
ncbi:hypothetical protein D3C75_1308720 [compost metagenome]